MFKLLIGFLLSIHVALAAGNCDENIVWLPVTVVVVNNTDQTVAVQADEVTYINRVRHIKDKQMFPIAAHTARMLTFVPGYGSIVKRSTLDLHIEGTDFVYENEIPVTTKKLTIARRSDDSFPTIAWGAQSLVYEDVA